ncbi:MAG: hypothetical protein JWQ14_2259 [Adhaeribacter sp.]|nr:hypothetical protein [Adhaeribacter sp.]
MSLLKRLINLQLFTTGVVSYYKILNLQGQNRGIIFSTQKST